MTCFKAEQKATVKGRHASFYIKIHFSHNTELRYFNLNVSNRTGKYIGCSQYLILFHDNPLVVLFLIESIDEENVYTHRHLYFSATGCNQKKNYQLCQKLHLQSTMDCIRCGSPCSRSSLKAFLRNLMMQAAFYRTNIACYRKLK